MHLILLTHNLHSSQAKVQWSMAFFYDWIIWGEVVTYAHCLSFPESTILHLVPQGGTVQMDNFCKFIYFLMDYKIEKP